VNTMVVKDIGKEISVDLDPYIGGSDCFRSLPRKAASAVVMVPFLACLVLQIVEYFLFYTIGCYILLVLYRATYVFSSLQEAPVPICEL
jgi:hypothetical protein